MRVKRQRLLIHRIGLDKDRIGLHVNRIWLNKHGARLDVDGRSLEVNRGGLHANRKVNIAPGVRGRGHAQSGSSQCGGSDEFDRE